MNTEKGAGARRLLGRDPFLAEPLLPKTLSGVQETHSGKTLN